jgi:hypothetical protein
MGRISRITKATPLSFLRRQESNPLFSPTQPIIPKNDAVFLKEAGGCLTNFVHRSLNYDRSKAVWIGLPGGSGIGLFRFASTLSINSDRFARSVSLLRRIGRPPFCKK